MNTPPFALLITSYIPTLSLSLSLSSLDTQETQFLSFKEQLPATSSSSQCTNSSSDAKSTPTRERERERGGETRKNEDLVGIFS
jgi:hypothetical protein